MVRTSAVEPPGGEGDGVAWLQLDPCGSWHRLSAAGAAVSIPPRVLFLLRPKPHDRWPLFSADTMQLHVPLPTIYRLSTLL